MPPMSSRRLFVLLLFVLTISADAGAQTRLAEAPPLPERWLQGYVRTLAGEWIVYPWAYPGQANTLLSRATDGRMAVEWEGEPAPAGAPGDLVSYLWHGGTASGYGAHRFTLAVNGRAMATFTSGRTRNDRAWSVAGEGGARLSFQTTRVGQFDELFGFMWLTAPRALFGDGAPRFAVTGEAAGSQDYYLGPQERVEPWTRVRPEEALFADGQRALRVAFSHIGPTRSGVVRSGGRVLWSGRIDTGYTTALVPANRSAAATVPVVVTIDGETVFDGDVPAPPVRPRAIHLLPHSHVDIGYSDPQPEVERKQWKNLRDAVALGAETASYPPEARFKWNVEGLWSVESYLQQATPKERDAFAAAVRAGTIGLQANYANILTGLATPDELRRWTDGRARLRARYGIGPGLTAVHSDIPGLSWTVVPALASAGVRYFSSGPNYMPGLPDGGDRIGGTLTGLGDRPFWWRSPSGEEHLLFWMAGRGYSWFHGLNAGGAPEGGRDAILDYLRALTETGYPYDMVQVRYTVGGDNGPVDRALPAFVKAWNERFATPRLVIDTADAMFAEFERRHGASVPVMSGDMTPYWEDGALSTAGEEALVRASARRLRQAETLAVLRNVRLPVADVEAAWRALILWREHTWGAADSVSQPDRPDVVAQWEYKRRFAVEADRLSRDLMAAASATGQSEGGAPSPGRARGASGHEAGSAPLEGAAPPAPLTVMVVNTLSWRRSGLVMLPAGLSRAGDRVLVDDTPTASQRLQDGRLAVWLDQVPPLSSVRLRLVPGPAASPVQRAAATERALENGRVRLVVDAAGGAIDGLTWTGTPGHEFSSGAPGLSRYLYVNGRDPGAAAASTGGTLTVEDDGPLVATVRIDGPAGGARSAMRRFRVVAGSDLVLAEIALDKLSVRSKESGHVAFPFNVPGGVIRADQGEALVEIPRDQLPGSCRDFIGVQSAIDVSGPALGVSLVSLDAPLVEMGALTDERLHNGRARSWREDVAPGTTLYAYLFNNYWHTNYKADQAGPLSFRFVIAPHAAFDPVALRRLSDEQDFPLLVIAGGEHDAPAVTAPFALEGDPVLVSSLRWSELDEATVVRLHNPAARPADLVVRSTRADTRMALAGQPGVPPAPVLRVTLPPRASRTVTLSPR